MELQAHDLHNEFPEFHDQIHALKVSDAHFQRLFDRYHEVNRHVVRIEVQAELATDPELEDLKKERLRLKDALFGMLQNCKVA
ncbi:MAG: YdcH family protein [Rhodocyclaceae bacterium]|nr:YdcH family protein [Rhodocyclaceae bacterium]